MYQYLELLFVTLRNAVLLLLINNFYIVVIIGGHIVRCFRIKAGYPLYMI